MKISWLCYFKCNCFKDTFAVSSLKSGSVNGNCIKSVKSYIVGYGGDDDVMLDGYIWDEMS